MIHWLRPIIISAAVFVLLVSLLQFLLGIMPRSIQHDRTPATYGMDYSNVSIRTDDGQTLSSWWIPAEKSSDRTVIVGHGYPASKSDIVSAVTFLHSDYNLLLFDFRYLGDSSGSYTTLGHDEQQDVEAAIDYVTETHPNHSIALYGFSMSAATFIEANDPRTEAIVADSPYASLQDMLDDVYWLFPGPLRQPFVWTTAVMARTFLGFWPAEMAPEQSVTSLEQPLLLIHGTADTNIPYQHSQRIYDNANKNRTQLHLFDGAGHVRSKHRDPDRYHKTVNNFLSQHLSDGT